MERVTNAFLKMKKFDLAELKKAYEGEGKILMAKLNAYLNFAGNAEEAFGFYKSILARDNRSGGGIHG